LGIEEAGGSLFISEATPKVWAFASGKKVGDLVHHPIVEVSDCITCDSHNTLEISSMGIHHHLFAFFIIDDVGADKME
jgi:hypothetical protein